MNGRGQAASTAVAGGLTGLETANCRVVCRFRPAVPRDKTLKPPTSGGKYGYTILSPIQVEVSKEQVTPSTKPIINKVFLRGQCLTFSFKNEFC